MIKAGMADITTSIRTNRPQLTARATLPPNIRDESANRLLERSPTHSAAGLPPRLVPPILLDTQGCRISSEPLSDPVVGNERSHIF
jgi:hypothetical protein